MTAGETKKPDATARKQSDREASPIVMDHQTMLVYRDFMLAGGAEMGERPAPRPDHK
ncbi:hypothetical protein MesoLj131c_62720 [Mesorhizobium sp. 131-3-5]|uniref:hypothetical protein n=1 Tax=Mesorhizobium sp. 131-3-5 TaxID=2744520 RepID=UPI0019258D82|nr:hypothetical protein [Mesorhizobium sp. 131-3-5]BCH12014.1 hypothetical protein MesoLj131c_62720 [Mesorhizobium sp. 131-3-5]